MQINPQIFREYDIRGIADKDLCPELYEILGKAIAVYTEGERPHNRMAVGYDGRLTSEEYANAVIRGLTWAGIDVVNVGMVPTPLLYFALFTCDVDGGVMITASHNPKEYNGMKVAVGTATIHGSQIQDLRKVAEAGAFIQGAKPGSVTLNDVAPAYIDRVAGDIKLARPLKVVVDAGNGPGGVVALPLYERLGCEVIPLFCDVDGRFPNHHPDPTVPENLKDAIAAVAREKADLAIGFDGDVDRIGIADEKGGVIFGDKLLILFARSILKEIPGATVISEVKGSRTLYDDVRKHGGNAIMWKTGHSLIKAAMKEFNAEVAGEMSGHMFFKHRWYGFDDAIYTGARLLELLAAESRTLSEHLADVPVMFSTAEIRVPTKESRKFALVEEAVHCFKDEMGLEVNTIDGARIEFPDGWGLVRASNTGPVLVMRFEAVSQKRLDEIRALVEGKVNELNR